MYLDRIRSGRYAEATRGVEAFIVPVGSFEAHGPHCPLGTDCMIPERLCADLEARMGDRIAVAPPIHYGYTPSLAAFPGTVTVAAETLISLYAEVGLGLAKWGAKRVVFMNGHGGNIAMLSVACDRIGAAGTVAAAISYWLHYSRDILGVCGTQGHAGEDETSLVLALDESLVEMGAARRHMRKGFLTPLSGPGTLESRFPEALNGDPGAASADKGRRLYELILERNVQAIERIIAGDYADDL